MDNASLIAAFKEATKSGWSVQSDVQVLKWLENFMERLQKRANTVTEEMHKLLEQTEAVEQDLYNTFNSFRGLSNTQFIENRVCESDEMTARSSDSSIQFSEVCVPTQRYEEDIVPRYKEALLSGWNGYKQYIQKSYRNTSEAIPHKVGLSNGQLPHIIGTEEFMRDNSCGLTEDRVFGMDPLELDGVAEGEGIHLASEMVGTNTLLEPDWSGTESDKDDQVGMEPSVSAALDFKAMLEAALRSPYIPCDDILSDSKSISGYEYNIGIDSAVSQVSGVSNSQPIIINQESSSSPIYANITSELMGATHQVVSSNFDRKLHPDTVAEGLFDSEAVLSTSILNEYRSLHSEPVDSSHIPRGGSFNERAKLKNSIHPEQINSSMEGKQDPHQPGSSNTSRKFNITEISGGLFEKKEESTSSRLRESIHSLSLPTAQNSEHTKDTKKINSETIGSKREKGVASKEPDKDLFGSSNFSRQSHGALFSGGLFDDEDELVSSSPFESVHVWSQPSVPERLYGFNSDAKKNELSPSTSISTVDQTGLNSSDKLITTDNQVSAESISQYSGTEQLEKTLCVNNEGSTGAPQFPKPHNGKQSPKKTLLPLQKGLFGSEESDEDHDPCSPFRAASSIGQKLRLHDRALNSDSNILQESSKVGVEFNIRNTKLRDFSEPHKVEQLHSTGAFGRTEGMFTIGDYHSNVTGFENPGVERRTSDSDESKTFGTPVDLTVKYALHPKKGAFSSPVMPSPKEDPHRQFVTAASTQNHLDYNSDSWSSSSSEKTIKSSILDVEANTISNYEINKSSHEKVVLEAKGISGPAGNSTSMLCEEGSVHSTQGAPLLEPTYGGTEYFSKKQEDTGKEDFSLPVSLSEYGTLPVDECVDERRVEETTILNQSIGFLNTSLLHENQSKDIQREEDKADPDVAHFHQISSSSTTERDLEDGALTFASSCASLFKNEELVTASGENVAIDAPQKTSGDWQTDSLQSSNDPLQDFSQYALAGLDDKTKDGQTVLDSGHFIRNIQKEPFSMSSSSQTQKDSERDILLSPSDKETKSNLSNSSISSQPEGFLKTSVSYPLEETKVPSIYSQLFGDEDEGEGNLFGAFPKTNPVIASLLKSPGKHLSLFDSDEE